MAIAPAGLLAQDSRALAEELYHLLRELDPARWRAEMAAHLHDRLLQLRGRVEVLLARREAAWQQPAFQAVREGLADLALQLETVLPARGLPGDLAAAAWAAFRAEMVPAYESLAARLRALDLHLPSLRPTNYTRNLFHVFNGVATIVLFQHLLSARGALLLALAFTSAAWFLELVRRLWSPFNVLIMELFDKVAHPHESFRVNSSTWYVTALALLALLDVPVATTVALGVLAVADPAAAVVGRRFGRIRLVNGRSLEGTATFFGVGLVAAFGLLSVYFPEIGAAHSLGIAVGAALVGALAELFSRRVDDNLSIPLSTAGAVLAISALLGG